VVESHRLVPFAIALYELENPEPVGFCVTDPVARKSVLFSYSIDEDKLTVCDGCGEEINTPSRLRLTEWLAENLHE